MPEVSIDADRVLRAAVLIALERRAHFDALDAAVGDGDLGSTLARGAVALALSPPRNLRDAAQTLTDAMGGSSGPLLGAAALRAHGSPEPVESAIEAIQAYGGAARGDKTMLDALFPVAEALAAGADVSAAAREGAKDTAKLSGRRGRAAYAGDRAQGTIDPGAAAVAEICEVIFDGSDLPTWAALAERVSQEVDGPRGDPLVDRAIDGLVLAHPELERLGLQRVVMRRRRLAIDGQVAIVSGGGAGHEPLHAGFVGAGMLDAACPGSVFTSPSPNQMVAAAEAVDAGAGVLFVVKNYTGDVLNFRLAAELLSGQVQTATVIVADDVATDADTAPGRRGTGATVVAEKLAGARAARGGDLQEVAAAARDALSDARSFGVAIHGEEMELGVGIHGEPGRPREPLVHGRNLSEVMLAPLLAEVRLDLPLLVLVSGLGGSTSLALHAAYADVRDALEESGATVARSLVGDLVTSLDQAGFIITLVPLTEERRELWDAPVNVPMLRW